MKTETCRVAARYGLRVVLVSNSSMRVPSDGRVELVVVPGSFDAADDWIAQHAGADDIVVTNDIPLAARCLSEGAVVLRPNGRRFTEDNIGDALASRELLSQLRDMGAVSGGPPPFDRKARSRFLQSLDEIVQGLRRKAAAQEGASSPSGTAGEGTRGREEGGPREASAEDGT